MGKVLNMIKALYFMYFKSHKHSSSDQTIKDHFTEHSEQYDDLREHLLFGRKEFYRKLEINKDSIWVEFGGGTGYSLELLGDKVNQLRKIYFVDLSEDLMEIAKTRANKNGWSNIEFICGNMFDFSLPEDEQANYISFSYSLSMIPDWQKAISHSNEVLAKNGKLLCIDFYLAEKEPVKNYDKQSSFMRWLYPKYFSFGDVHLDERVLPKLNDVFKEEFSGTDKKRPFFALIKSPFFYFIGQKRQ